MRTFALCKKQTGSSFHVVVFNAVLHNSPRVLDNILNFLIKKYCNLVPMTYVCNFKTKALKQMR